MKTYNTGDGEIQVVDYQVQKLEDADGFFFEITEGEFSGVKFQLEDIRMDEEDESQMFYELKVEEGQSVEALKPVVDNIIIGIMCEQIEYEKKRIAYEKATNSGSGTVVLTDAETGEELNPDA